MASGVAALSSIIPPLLPPTFGGGTPVEQADAAKAGSSQPTGISSAGAPSAIEKQPSLIKLPTGTEGIYTPTKPNYLTYHPGSGLGGMQDMTNLMKNIRSGAQDPNQEQLNGGRTNRIDTEPVNNYTSAPDIATADQDGQPLPITIRQPSQVEPTVGIGTGAVATGPPLQPSQVEPTFYGEPSPIGGDQQLATAMTAAAAGAGFNAVNGMATTFGLNPNTQVNPDGTVDAKYFDQEDTNPLTAFGYNHHDPNLRGASLPVDVITQSIGDYQHNPQVYQAIKSGRYKVAITNPTSGATKIVNLVDAGPGLKTGNAVDLTWRTQKDLGLTGKDKVGLQLIGPDGSTIPLKGYHPGTVSSQQQPSTAPERSAKDSIARAQIALDLGTNNLDDPRIDQTLAERQQIAQAAPATTTEAALPEEPTSAIAAATEAPLPEEPSPATTELLPQIDETAGEFKAGGLVKKYQTGGLATPGNVAQQNTPAPATPPPMPPAQAQTPFIAHVRGMVKGGKIPGKGEGDKISALLEPGEFVLTKEAVKRIGVDKLEEMNHG